MNKFIFITLTVLMVGCAQVPTKIYETQELNLKLLVDAAKKPLVIDSSTIVIDSRSAFDYTMAHFPGSININWEDFSNPKSQHPGVLTKDLFKETRRLALKGISPEDKVIILGDGEQGNGEEGRLAWTFLYLGIKDVQFAALNNFPRQLTNSQTAPKKNVSPWRPKTAEGILATKDEVKNIVENKGEVKTRRVILDVRTKKEYFSKDEFGGQYKYPDINAINIEWTEFITRYGRPDGQIREYFKDLGIDVDTRIVLISNQGVRSGAATAALLSLGYGNASNYVGGYKELFGKK